MPDPTNVGGFDAYSTIPLFEGAKADFKEARPGQAAAIDGFFIDPVTGANPNRPSGPVTPAPTPVAFSDNGPAYNSHGFGAPAAGGDSHGFTGFMDMIDGGGAGASGDTFQGGGLISNVANRVTSPREGGGSMGGGK